MSYYQYFPTPSDRMGSLWTLDSIEGAYIIEFGPAGTTHFSVEGIVNMNGESKAKLFTTHISEHDLTFGDTGRLEASIREVDENYKPKVIFVFSSSLASVIGIDIKSVCIELKSKVKSLLIPVDTGGFKGDFSLGVKQMLKSICKDVVLEGKDRDHSKYNIIGGQIDEFNHRSDIEEIKYLMKEMFDLECHCVFSLDSSMELIQEASKASFNVVLRSEAIDGAEIMKERFDQPFILRRPYGSEQVDCFFSDIEDAMGLIRNKEKFDFLNEKLNRAQYRVSMLNKNEDYKVLVSGNMDATSGIVKFLKEVGFNNVLGLVNHKKCKKRLFDDTLSDELLYNLSEFEKKEILSKFKPDIVLGDGVLIRFAEDNEIKACMQIANPNIDKIMFYDKTPYVGLNGGIYLCEQIANLVSGLKY